MRLTRHAPRLFAASGGLLSLLFFSIAWLGLPTFRAGHWNDEPIVLGMFICSTVVALWLALGIFLRWLEVALPRRNILFNLWVAWLVWQCVVTAFAASPWRSWFGPPEQSEGLAWYLCASLLMLLFSALWHISYFKKIILGYSFLLTFALAVLHLVSDAQNNMFAGFFFPPISETTFEHWLPFVWPDYLGYMAAWWWIALMLTTRDLKLRWLLPISLLMLIIIIASSNHGALAFISYAMLITLAVRILPMLGLPYFRHVTKAWRNMASIALLLPVLWLLASPYIPTRYSGNVSQSVPTRVLLNHISITALADRPQRLLLGSGWGRFADDFFAYSLIRDVRIYDDGKHRPNWPLVRGYNYHSHNMASETLLSLGLIGFLLWLLMPIIAVRRLPAEYFWRVVPMLVAVTLLQHLWFAMPQAMPLQALCWFLLIKKTSPNPQSLIPNPRYTALIPLLAAAALAWSTSAQWETIRYSALYNDPFGQRYGKPFTQADMETDIKRGGDRLRSFFISYTKRLSANEESIQPKHLALYHAYLKSAAALANDPRTGAYNAAAILYGYNVLISSISEPQFQELQREAASNYFTLATLHTKRAPYREDIIAPFLQAIFLSKNDADRQKIMGIVQELLAVNPAHRSALWIGGKVLSEQSGFAPQGREMMQTALALGADRVFLIPNTEIKALQDR